MSPRFDPSDLATRPVRAVFTSRAGGVSSSPYDSFNLGAHVDDDLDAVTANRERLAATLGLASEHFVWMEQLHTNNVTVIDGPREEPVPSTDALVTSVSGLALAVLVADCTPVLISDATHNVVAAVHAGRMGARNGIVAKTVEVMCGLGATPPTMQVLMGPAASGRNYEVPEEMADDVEKHLPGSRAVTDKGTAGIDVRAGLLRQLEGLGITNVFVDPRCTIDDTDFFSYRREGTTGRQAGVIWLNEDIK